MVKRQCKTADFPAEKLLQISFVLPKLAHNFAIYHTVHIRVGKGMGSNLVAFVQLHNCFLWQSCNLHTIGMCPAELLFHKLAVKVECAFDIVFVQQFHKAYILQNAVIIGDVKGFAFAVGIEFFNHGFLLDIQ